MAADEGFGSLLKWVAYTALIVAIGLAGIIFPFLGYTAVVLLPIPVVFIIMERRLESGLLCLGCAALVVYFAVPQPDAPMSLLQYGLLGIVLGLLLKSKVSSGGILMVTMAAAIGLAVVAAGGSFWLTGANPIVLSPSERSQLSEQWSTMNQQMRLFEGIAPGSGTTDGTISEGAEAAEEDSFQFLTDLFEYFLPGQFVVTAGVTAAFSYILTVLMLARYGHKIAPRLTFSGIRLPWYSIWGLIVGFGLFLLGDLCDEVVAKVGKNLLFVLANLFFILGLAVFVHYFQKVQVLLVFKLLVLLLMVFYYPFSFVLLLLVGILDPLVDFRRLPRLKQS